MKTKTAPSAAAALGWFSIGLGLAQLLATRHVARATGMHGRERLLRVCGARELVTGIGILAARNPTPWMWARVAGDALDLAGLARSPRKARAAAAMAAVAGVTALDVQTAGALRRAEAHRTAYRDYSSRSGFPKPPAEMRGIAADVARNGMRWPPRPAPARERPRVPASATTGIPG